MKLNLKDKGHLKFRKMLVGKMREAKTDEERKTIAKAQSITANLQELGFIQRGSVSLGVDKEFIIFFTKFGENQIDFLLYNYSTFEIEHRFDMFHDKQRVRKEYIEKVCKDYLKEKYSCIK